MTLALLLLALALNVAGFVVFNSGRFGDHACQSDGFSGSEGFSVSPPGARCAGEDATGNEVNGGPLVVGLFLLAGAGVGGAVLDGRRLARRAPRSRGSAPMHGATRQSSGRGLRQ